METVETVTLEDGITYVIINEIIINNVKYVYLAQENNITKFCIKKVNIINGSEYLVPITNKDEFNQALLKFKEKNQSN